MQNSIMFTLSRLAHIVTHAQQTDFLVASCLVSNKLLDIVSDIPGMAAYLTFSGTAA